MIDLVRFGVYGMFVLLAALAAIELVWAVRWPRSAQAESLARRRTVTRVMRVGDEMMEKLVELSDKRVLEALRCRVVFPLSDAEERMRCLQYLGVLGRPEDDEFLKSVANDKDENDMIRLRARQARRLSKVR